MSSVELAAATAPGAVCTTRRLIPVMLVNVGTLVKIPNCKNQFDQ